MGILWYEKQSSIVLALIWYSSFFWSWRLRIYPHVIRHNLCVHAIETVLLKCLRNYFYPHFCFDLCLSVLFWHGLSPCSDLWSRSVLLCFCSYSVLPVSFEQSLNEHFVTVWVPFLKYEWVQKVVRWPHPFFMCNVFPSNFICLTYTKTCVLFIISFP
jgi:hypothetical protein